MTAKDKLIEARRMALQIKSIANSIEYDARDYDVTFPLNHARRLNEIADNFLKLK